MRYLHSRNESGAYSSPQNYPFEGAIALNDDQLATFLAFKGFGTVDGGVFTGNQTMLDAWDAAHQMAEGAEQNNTPVTLESFATQLEATQSVLDALLMGNITI